MSELTPTALDDYARTYYLSGEVEDLDIEDLQQEMSVDRLVGATGDAQRVLDMGFGTGLIAAALLRQGRRTEVVEGSTILAKEARRRHADLVVHEAMFEDFAPQEPYDAILALHVLEHVADPRRLLSRVATWLVPGGTLVVAVPNRESLHRRLAVIMDLQPELDSLSARDSLVGHRRVYGFDTLTADLASAGFDVVDRFGWFLKTVPNSMMLDWPDGLLRALFDLSPELPPELLANIAVRAVLR